MGFHRDNRLLRPITLIVLFAIIFLLSLGNSVWATPNQQSSTVPQPTPGDDDDDDDDDDDEIDGGIVNIPPGLQEPSPEPDASPEPEPPAEPSPEPPPSAIPPDSIVIDIAPGERGELDLFPWVVIITPDDFDQPVDLGGRLIPADGTPGTPEGDVCVELQLDLIIVDQNGNQIPPSAIRGPIEVRYILSPEQLEAIQDDPTRVIIRVYDPDRGVWIDLITVVNPDGSVSVFVNFTGLFTLCLLPPEPVLPVVLPETGIEDPIPVPAMLPDTSEPVAADLPLLVREHERSERSLVWQRGAQPADRASGKMCLSTLQRAWSPQ